MRSKYIYVYFIIEIAMSLFLYMHPIILAMLLLVMFWIGNKFFFNRLISTIYFVALVIGTFGERLCVYIGIWEYKYSTIGNLPMWLPFVWGNAGICIYCIAYDICKFLDKN